MPYSTIKIPAWNPFREINKFIISANKRLQTQSISPKMKLLLQLCHSEHLCSLTYFPLVEETCLFIYISCICILGMSNYWEKVSQWAGCAFGQTSGGCKTRIFKSACTTCSFVLANVGYQDQQRSSHMVFYPAELQCECYILFTSLVYSVLYFSICATQSLF